MRPALIRTAIVIERVCGLLVCGRDPHDTSHGDHDGSENKEYRTLLQQRGSARGGFDHTILRSDRAFRRVVDKSF
jgi:hypothetical protein